jgi:glycine betaine/proline transport system ATP-binding protein
VLRPANDYVAAFVAHLDPLAVLSAGDVMRPLAPGERADGPEGAVAAARPVRDLLGDLAARYPRPLVVTDAGRPIGVVGPGEVIAALVRRDNTMALR